jgi:hypothetical protein
MISGIFKDLLAPNLVMHDGKQTQGIGDFATENHLQGFFKRDAPHTESLGSFRSMLALRQPRGEKPDSKLVGDGI